MTSTSFDYNTKSLFGNQNYSFIISFIEILLIDTYTILIKKLLNKKPLATGLDHWCCFTQEMREKGIHVINLELKVEWVIADKQIADFFSIPKNKKVLKLSKLKGTEGDPIVYFESYFHPRIGVNEKDDYDIPLYPMLEQKYGVIVVRSLENISARHAGIIGKKLKIGASEPVLYRERFVYDIGEKPIEYNLGFYRSDILFVVLVYACSSCKQKTTLFHLVSSAHSGILFNNAIVENDSINPINVTNIYNGGGVGIGDFNNDGLQDVYFTGSLVSNKLYLNKGEMQFTDITTAAGLSGDGKWCRGVAVVDINNDGRMDMYVCASMDPRAEKRKNILYVNQGLDKNKVPVFKDMAAEYGLDDSSYSTMANFFDYDKISSLTQRFRK